MSVLHARRWALVLVFALSLVAGHRGNAQVSPLPVFPGAEGFGAKTRAAYGGAVPPTVVRVTNLRDSGVGSLRAALTAAVPRVVVFEISGTIALESPISITSPYLTVAGATAPSPGITVRNYEISVRTHDVLIQHIRSRVGSTALASGSAQDGFNAYTTAAYNVVFDHLSVAWAVDGSIDVSNGSRDITISNCLVAEHLTVKGLDHSRGHLVYQNARNVALLRNVTAHVGQRLPVLKANSRAVVANNLFYDQFRSIGTNLQDPDGLKLPIYASIVGNRWVQGPSAALLGVSLLQAITVRSTVAAGSKLYNAANGVEGPSYVLFRTETFDPTVSSPPAEAPISGLTILPQSELQAHVLASAGARPADRDRVDARVVSQVQKRAGRYVKDPTEVGGWPILAVNTRALTIPQNPHMDGDGDGYTNLEEWLHAYSAAVEGGSPSLTLSPPAAPTSVRVVP